MFIGHYAPAAAIKSVAPKVPLWHLFVAVQFLDYLWAGFILAGIEHARVAPGFLAASHLDLYDMPYTHSLAGAALWSVLAGVAYGGLLNRRAGAAGGLAIGAAVLSHWFADLLVHASDLALYPGSAERFGFGLWSSLAVSQTLEFAFLLAGFVLYLRASAAKGPVGRVSPFFLLVCLCALQLYSLTSEPPADIAAFAGLALVSYTLIAALAAFVDATRTAR
ncbi:MAG: hypothetical protein R3C51_11695 [Parvularculaceae bacterium]